MNYLEMDTWDSFHRRLKLKEEIMQMRGPAKVKKHTQGPASEFYRQFWPPDGLEFPSFEGGAPAASPCRPEAAGKNP